MRRLWCLVLMLASAVSAASFAPVTYVMKPVTAKVPWYTVQPSLANVSNRQQLPQLTTEQRKALTTTGFVARPTKDEQIFYLYEDNNYKAIPSFVTTDSVLHTYHIFFNFTLRWLEQHKLLPALGDLTGIMLRQAFSAAAGSHPDLAQQALNRNIAYFAVPARLLGLTTPPLPPEVERLVLGELDRIKKHSDRGKCLTNKTIDYTQFIPRGHYTRNADLTKYFLAMLWYGLVPMDLRLDDPIQDPVADNISTVMALTITELLANHAEARVLWGKLFDPTVFFVGQADDLTYDQILPAAQAIFGRGALDRYADAAKLDEFRRRAKDLLPQPRIVNEMNVHGREEVQGREFRFMGQRYIPDSRILQELCYPKVGTQEMPREVPLGLDVFAVLGSQRAEQLLDVVYEQPKFENYLSQRQKLQAEFAKLTTDDWQQNLYHGWLYSLQPLLRIRPEGYPAFMRNLAWRDKSLITCLASWTQLRHDTVLYGKQSVAEAGGDEPPPPAGYVEPEPDVYERLAWLLRLTKSGLQLRGYIAAEDDSANAFDSFAELCDQLAVMSRKELLGQPLTTEELSTIKWYGSTLESLMIRAAVIADPEKAPLKWWLIENKTDRHMALATDVHTSRSQVLQEAIGNPAELWVVAPFKNRLVAFRGAMFTQYEFMHPSADRLTDEAWQKKLAEDKIPPLAPWAAKIIQAPGLTKPTRGDYEIEG